MSKQTRYDKVDILGVNIDVISLSEAIEYICTYATDHAKPAAYVVKPYVEFLDRAAGNPELTTRLNEAELAIADGVAVIWAAHYLYAGPRTFWRFWVTLAQIVAAPRNLEWPLQERAAGVTFTWPLLKAAAAADMRVYIIGKETTAEIELVISRIIREIPDILIAGASSGRDQRVPRGQVSPAWITQTTARIAATKADLILVGMGFPLQEHVCAQLAQQLDHGVFIGEGGTFDYESFGGVRRKAPASVQRIGFEWLWRLALEPKRIIRQLAIPRYLYRIWKSR